MNKRKGTITRPPGYKSRHLNVIQKQEKTAAESGAYPIETDPEPEPKKLKKPGEILAHIRKRQFDATKRGIAEVKKSRGLP